MPSKNRTALFLDGPHLLAATRSLGFVLDFKKLLESYRRSDQLVRATYYSVVAQDSAGDDLKTFIDWLSYNGYSTVTKPSKTFFDADGNLKTKGSCAVELAIDVMRIAVQVDQVVIFAGDDVYRALVQAVQELGVHVTVISTVQTSPKLICSRLRRQADRFVDLSELSPSLQTRNRHSLAN